MPTEPPYPTPGIRTKSPSWLPYAKYELSRSFSKSSHQIHSGLGVSHSAASVLMGHTVITAAPLWLSLVATIRAVPGARPLTKPFGETVAVSGFRLTQEILRPARGRLLRSFTTTLSC